MREWIRKLLQVRDTPEAQARGLAIGFFFGVCFIWGLQMGLAVLVSHFLRGNKVLAAAMTAISNPLTSLPLYSFCYVVGHFMMGGSDILPDFSQIQSLEGILTLGPRFFLTMLAGSILVGLVGAVIVYFSSQRLLQLLCRFHRKDRNNEASCFQEASLESPTGTDSGITGGGNPA